MRRVGLWVAPKQLLNSLIYTVPAWDLLLRSHFFHFFAYKGLKQYYIARREDLSLFFMLQVNPERCLTDVNGE